mmetsp:Transcript_7302/g.11108  ORF Transcript_7302/g.11108 Transcript_7302/m.11108 type:complete len:359 (-) Transcript_7302:319-1395(-)|eukprot:CAMPEP_0167770032 /NCGR_PEP_ID=MMETSP0110_2-20121227/17672_1 /TAXON_ID=629695 /ORGANISM="Gymnochlora sp., Strain CCMP2014" /LENGTH=358 /DNA_ID=CAMNT_0007659121 /DNA_START=32 /DNA_END=1108 /DNA_ORIENTATION=-
MGLCASTEDAARSHEVDRQLKKERKKDGDIHKMLLLGAGQSGKSTVFKQMTSIYGEGFPEHERKTYTPIVFENTITSMQVLIEEAQIKAEGKGGSDFVIDSSLDEEKKTIIDSKPREMNSKVALAISKLWKDNAIQNVFRQRSSFQLNDSAPYYFERVLEVGKEGYIPTEDDVMRSRARTTGVIQNKFIIDGNHFHMFDVGGQRSERKKWIHCFEGVSAVLYVCAISAYDQVLFEDGETNRIVEAINLFDEIISSRWFETASTILFLNKRDIFQEKIKITPITVSPPFAEYTGGNTYDETTLFIQDVFEERNTKDRPLYTHVTCATDRSNVNFVFNSVKTTIMSKGLADAGLTPVRVA